MKYCHQEGINDSAPGYSHIAWTRGGGFVYIKDIYAFFDRLINKFPCTGRDNVTSLVKYFSRNYKI